MKRSIIATLLCCASPALAQGSPAPMSPTPAPIVFFDIAGPDAARQSAFYHAVFGWQTGAGGTLMVPITGASLSGALRQDPADKILYLGVEDIDATMAQIEAHGGRIVHRRFAVKGIAVLGLFTDPAGNSMGLVEMRDGKPVVP